MLVVLFGVYLCVGVFFWGGGGLWGRPLVEGYKAILIVGEKMFFREVLHVWQY